MKNMVAWLVLVLCAFTLSCSPATSSRYREGDQAGRKATLSIYEEQRLTREALEQIRRDFPPVKSAELQRYVSRLGGRIVSANRLEGKPYHYDFIVIDADNINAFSLPAGMVFITAPLIAKSSSEAELAGVIGHEVGHVMARHAAGRIHAIEQEEKRKWLYAAGGGVVGAAAGLGIGLLLYPGVAVGGAAGAGGGLLVQKIHSWPIPARTN